MVLLGWGDNIQIAHLRQSILFFIYIDANAVYVRLRLLSRNLPSAKYRFESCWNIIKFDVCDLNLKKW